MSQPSPPLGRTTSNVFISTWYDEEDPVLSKLCKRERGRYENFRDFAENTRKKYGIDKMAYWQQPEEVERDEDGMVVVNEDGDYSKAKLEAMADALLRDYGKEELCKECLEINREHPGEPTGHIERVPVYTRGTGEPVLNEDGTPQTVDYPEVRCPLGHVWFRGEGKARGNDGENPVLFEEHLAQRRRREIYTSGGTPDPNIVSGIYNRTHPQGRKQNTDKQRKEHGASFYRN